MEDFYVLETKIMLPKFSVRRMERQWKIKNNKEKKKKEN
jgi:hypothetical protein